MCYWRSTDQLSEESSDETDQLQYSLEEKTVAVRGVSEENKLVQEDNPEMMTHSVSEEIKRFEKEINKVAEDNVKYPTWKQKKTGLKQIRESQENVKDSKKDIEKYKAEQLPPKRKIVRHTSAPELPPKRKNNKKSVLC